MDEKRYLETPLKVINLEKEFKDSLILDIGGGGEGFISRLYGRDVIAIDIRKDELIELGDVESIRVVMDATNMNFLDGQFDVVTSFFTLMYMGPGTQDKVIGEAFRVLKSGGILEIWDTVIPKISDDRDIFLLNLNVNFGGHSVMTGYGVQMSDQMQSSKGIKKILLRYDFEVVNESVEDDLIRIKLKKN
jgi:ubiquinone/menaquinone biosynthesis C-methylase UbiE